MRIRILGTEALPPIGRPTQRDSSHKPGQSLGEKLDRKSNGPREINRSIAKRSSGHDHGVRAARAGKIEAPMAEVVVAGEPAAGAARGRTGHGLGGDRKWGPFLPPTPPSYTAQIQHPLDMWMTEKRGRCHRMREYGSSAVASLLLEKKRWRPTK